MSSTILGKKLGMTQIIDHLGNAIPVTLVQAGPCTIIQLKTVDKEGYNAVKLGFGQAKRVKAPQAGQFKDMGKFSHLREFRVADVKDIAVGDKFDVSLFKAGDTVDVTGVSKGKGFAGTIKRHGFHGGPKTHGQSDRHRAPGSIGAGTSPGRVLKGTKMSGHMGDVRVTVRRLKVLEADAGKNRLLVRGAVPGGKNGVLLIRKSER